MHYFISLLFILIIFSVEAADTNSTITKSNGAVPHNNGTQGLLKNTYIEPIDNFNSIGSEHKKANNNKPKSNSSQPKTDKSQQQQQQQQQLSTPNVDNTSSNETESTSSP
jgi:hypothetical protein